MAESRNQQCGYQRSYRSSSFCVVDTTRSSIAVLWTPSPTIAVHTDSWKLGVSQVILSSTGVRNTPGVSRNLGSLDLVLGFA